MIGQHDWKRLKIKFDHRVFDGTSVDVFKLCKRLSDVRTKAKFNAQIFLMKLFGTEEVDDSYIYTKCDYIGHYDGFLSFYSIQQYLCCTPFHQGLSLPVNDKAKQTIRQKLSKRKKIAIAELLKACPLTSSAVYFEWLFSQRRFTCRRSEFYRFAVILDLQAYMRGLRTLFENNSIRKLQGDHLRYLAVQAWHIRNGDMLEYPNVLYLLCKHYPHLRHRLAAIIESNVLDGETAAGVAVSKVTTTERLCFALSGDGESMCQAVMLMNRQTDAEICPKPFMAAWQRDQLVRFKRTVTETKRSRFHWSIFADHARDIFVALSPLQLPSLILERIVRYLFGESCRLVRFGDICTLADRVRESYRRRAKN